MSAQNFSSTRASAASCTVLHYTEINYLSQEISLCSAFECYCNFQNCGLVFLQLASVKKCCDSQYLHSDLFREIYISFIIQCIVFAETQFYSDNRFMSSGNYAVVKLKEKTSTVPFL